MDPTKLSFVIMQPISLVTTLMLLWLIYHGQLMLAKRANMTIGLLCTSFFFQINLCLYVWLDHSQLSPATVKIWYHLLNTFGILLIASQLFLEIEYLKILAVIGSISHSMCKSMQFAVLILSFLLGALPMLLMVIQLLKSPDLLDPHYRYLYSVYQIALDTCQALMFVFEMGQFYYTYYTVKRYSLACTEEHVHKLFKNIKWIILCAFVADSVSLYCALPQTPVEAYFTAINILNIFHLPMIALMIHLVNQILLPQMIPRTLEDLTQSSFDLLQHKLQMLFLEPHSPHLSRRTSTVTNLAPPGSAVESSLGNTTVHSP
ncbi:hypothetical protein EDD86DRAFT_212527 [Gorgonomyces haynaldii]|nr:hypothetical protein EDD86DRAFT_212527 [Gorgonomyces haynaldii]